MLTWIFNRIVRSVVFRFVMLRVVPYVRLTMYYPKMNGHQYHDLYEKLQPGHIVLCVDYKKLTHFLVPGVMTHAALCVGKRPRNLWEVAEMTHTNYTKSHFFDICKEADRVIVMHVMGWEGEYLKNVVAACHALSAAKYDLSFTLGIKDLYCSELVYQSDRIAAHRMKIPPRLQVNLQDVHGLGKQYISPDGLMFARNARCIADSDHEWTHLTGPEIKMLVKGKG